MLDLRLIREDPEGVKSSLARRDASLPDVIDGILAKDSEWRSATETAEGLRATQRAESEKIAAGKRAGEDVSDALARMKELSAEVKELTERAKQAQEELQSALAPLPNT